MSPDDAAPPVKRDLDVLSETAAVVVPDGLGVPEGLFFFFSEKHSGRVHCLLPSNLGWGGHSTSIMGLEASTLSSMLVSPEEQLTVAK